ncbi:MAG: hypothetical protein J5851_03765 [Oscillospiraceae bacterium]|nr:hypothetical protein [Oscillospiraceae bacterium]
MKKSMHLARNLVAGGAVLTVVTCAVAPLMLKTGIKALKKAADKFQFDPASGRITPKDQDVIVLQKGAYSIETEDETSGR